MSTLKISCGDADGDLGVVCAKFKKILECHKTVKETVCDGSGEMKTIEAAMKKFPHLQPAHMFGPSTQAKCSSNANPLRQLGGVADELHIVNYAPYKGDGKMCDDDDDDFTLDDDDKKMKRVQSLHIFRTALKKSDASSGLCDGKDSACFQSRYGILGVEYGVSRKSHAVGKVVREAVHKCKGHVCSARIPADGTAVSSGPCSSVILSHKHACCVNKFTVAWNVPASAVHDILRTASLRRMFSSACVAFQSKFNFGYNGNTEKEASGVYHIDKHRLMYEEQCPLEGVALPTPSNTEAAVESVPTLLSEMLNSFSPALFSAVKKNFETEKKFLNENLDDICKSVVKSISETYKPTDSSACFNAAENRAKNAKAVLSCIISALSGKSECGKSSLITIKASA